MTAEEKWAAILENEKQFASRIALEVIDKPVLALWMILIPVFFVFYFWQLKRYSNGLRDFTKNFLITRERSLQTAYEGLPSTNTPHVDEIVEQAADLTEKQKKLYRQWVEVLVCHYHHLLLVDGDSYEELVRNHYRKKSNFLLAMNQLNISEKQFNRELFQQDENTAADAVQTVVEEMEQAVEKERKKEARLVFS